MKIIFRADDVGYTPVSNRGAFRSIDHGLVSLTEVMMDCPGSRDALEFLKDRPWISINWHTHWWGKPVAGAENVPSLSDGHGNFRKELGNAHRYGASGVDFDDMVKECRAEVEFCIKITGRAPDCTDVGKDVIGQAKKAVCDEYGIVYGYSRYYHYGEQPDHWHRAIPGHLPGVNTPDSFDPKYEDKKIFEYENFGRPGLYLKDYKVYDPMEMIRTIPESDNVWVRCEHPGYVDLRIWEDTAEICSITRCKDVECFCSQELRDWVKENHAEIMNLRDALYGSREYQNHLAAIGSDLAVARPE